MCRSPTRKINAVIWEQCKGLLTGIRIRQEVNVPHLLQPKHLLPSVQIGLKIGRWSWDRRKDSMDSTKEGTREWELGPRWF